MIEPFYPYALHLQVKTLVDKYDLFVTIVSAKQKTLDIEVFCPQMSLLCTNRTVLREINLIECLNKCCENLLKEVGLECESIIPRE